MRLKERKKGFQCNFSNQLATEDAFFFIIKYTQQKNDLILSLLKSYFQNPPFEYLNVEVLITDATTKLLNQKSFSSLILITRNCTILSFFIALAIL